jgi:hypothetical protein
MALSMTSTALRLPGSSRAVFQPARTNTGRRISFVVRAEQSLGDKIEEKTKEFVEATKENSGLDLGNLNEQPGNRSKQALGEIQTPKGDVSEVLSFSGLLPELINSRAAMLGMLAAFGAELSTREPVFLQIQRAPVLILGTFVTIVIASLAPVLRNANLNIDGAGPFTQKAEVVNGRIAMVAFALLIAVETWKAGPGLVP